MADKKPSGFRFRLPWLQQAATPTPSPEPPTQRPPFRPPGRAAPVRAGPSIVATPAPAFPRPSPPQSVPKSPIAETIEPVAEQPTEEKQTATETVKTTETQTQTTTETIPPIETVGPTTPPQTPPTQPQSQQPSPPNSPPHFQLPSLPVSPTRIRTSPQANSQSRSPSRMATPSKPSSLSSPEASPPRETSPPSSMTQTPPKSPSKKSSTPSSPDIKRSTEITKAKGTQTPHSMEPKSQKPKPISASTRVALPREIKDDISKFIHKIATTTSPSKHSINEQLPNIITIAGDNKGAFMHLNSDAVKSDTKHDSKLGENEETKAIVNSNIQGINNSMMFNSSVTKRNPGVHLVITRKLPADMKDTKMKNAESMDMQRAEFNVSPPQKVIYDPTIGVSMLDDYEPDDFETSANSYEIQVL